MIIKALGLVAVLMLLLLWRGRLTGLPLHPADPPLPETADRAGGLVPAGPPPAFGLSSVLAIEDGAFALALRVMSIRSARQSIDMQYYIIRNDAAGQMVLAELVAAAKRGVRVRLLLDDNGSWGLDAALVDLDRLPMAAVRLFNPFRLRSSRMLNYLADFSRLNRRMHNKSLTVDGVATLVGGRNVGDEYSGGDSGLQFADLDILAGGAIVAEVAGDFERYWNCASAWPVGAIVRTPRRRANGAADHDRNAAYAQALAEAPERLGAAAADFVWVPVGMVSDDPAKGLGSIGGDRLMAGRLLHEVAAPQSRLAIVSPYFLPTASGEALLAGLVDRGVKVAVFTNSAASINEPMVHARYSRARRRLLRAGITLWEAHSERHARLGLQLSGSGGSTRPSRKSRGVALHAKTFAIDSQILFVGSFNFDPRSLMLNTELGFVIECPQLAEKLDKALFGGIAPLAWQLAVVDGALAWRHAGRTVFTEPGTDWQQRLFLRTVGLLPIDWLL